MPERNASLNAVGEGLLVVVLKVLAGVWIDGGNGANNLSGRGAASPQPAGGGGPVISDGAEGGVARALDCAERALAVNGKVVRGGAIELVEVVGGDGAGTGV